MLQIVEEQAEAERFSVVVEIHLEVGRLSGVEPDSLKFCFEAIRAGTIASAAELMLTVVPGIALCRSCETECEIENHFDPCCSCGAFGLQVLSGNTMRVTGLEVE
jgi:hydrogenase nickel incorporation protein HypA/HybF